MSSCRRVSFRCTSGGRERGGALVEAGLTFPLVFLCFVAVFEFGLAFRSYVSASSASLSGARAASAAANEFDADQRVLAAVRRDLSGIPRSEIVTIVVFDARRAGESVLTSTRLAGCLTGSVLGVCNRYSVADLAAPAASFGCGTGAIDRSWCPRSRSATRAGGTALVGVFVRLRHASPTGLLPTTVTIDQQSVLTIEARKA